MKQFVVYILTNINHTVLYVGVTSNLHKRLWEHKNKAVKGFTEKYNCTIPIYYEQTENVWSALEREKQLKKWSRKKKELLIAKSNPQWKDLSESI